MFNVNFEAMNIRDEIEDILYATDLKPSVIEGVTEKLLNLHSVSQQRELLKKWWKYFDKESVAVNCNDEEREEVINDFFNCG